MSNSGVYDEEQHKRFSCMSIKSEWSIERAIDMQKEPSAASETSDSLSLKSKSSMNEPIAFKGNQSIDRRSQHNQDQTSEKANIPYGKPLDSIFMELEQEIVSLVKRELKRFKNLLSSDYPACSEREVKEEENESQSRQGILKITLQILKKLKQADLANNLLTKLTPSSYQKIKLNLKNKCKKINEGALNQENSACLDEIYTELYITEGGSGEVNNEHEVRQIETASRRPATQETPIKCNELFKDKAIRTVLTKGVAGIGKTVSVQKFILDWADGKANQDVHCIFPLSFRELNLMKGKNISLMELLQCFLKELSNVRISHDDNHKVMFIFDGLDECRLPLDFQNNESLFNVTQSASVDVLLTNLIKGNLLPSALIWITTRPAAANQIPPKCVDQVTEVRGFSDTQKEEYFRKRISDKNLADKIITHIKSSRSLYIMCHIPVFCWIAVTVLQRMLTDAENEEIPKTLTQMFTHLLIFQAKSKSENHHRKYEIHLLQTRENILALAKLAFQQLEKGNLIFYEEDLRECGIDVTQASVFSGVCTQIFREEFGLHLGKVFSFVHLSVQEYLAALYVVVSYINKNVPQTQFIENNGFSTKLTMSDLLKSAVDKALQSKNGHLDLFLRFLLGLSLESNQTLLNDLLREAGNWSCSKAEIVKHLKKKIKKKSNPEKCINLFYCLNELNDQSLVTEVQSFLKKHGSGRLTGVRLTHAQWSALLFVLLTSKEELEEFKLSKFDPSEECLRNLLPVVQTSQRAKLNNCNLTEQSCEVLGSALSSHSTNLRELNLSNNEVQDAGLTKLSAGLENPHCKLEILSLNTCKLTDKSCAVLASALSSNASCLKELDLSYNKLQDSGVKLLSAGLEKPHCKLEILSLYKCSITDKGCGDLVSALKLNPSHLRELNLGMNEVGDLGIDEISALLKEPVCKLEKIMMSHCHITEKGCATLASALKRNISSQLRELNLNYNKPGDSGVKVLSDLLEDPCCKLEKLHLDPPCA